jgi:hypothetical protein
MPCPSGGVAGGELDSCRSDPSSKYFSFVMKDRSGASRGTALLVGMEQFLLKFFPAAQAPAQPSELEDLAVHTPGEGEADV